jgi:hypothetical protein
MGATSILFVPDSQAICMTVMPDIRIKTTLTEPPWILLNKVLCVFPNGLAHFFERV